MTSPNQICTDYAAAFRAAKGSEASAEFDGKRFAITNGRGTTAGYSERDMLNLIRALKTMAA